MMKKTLLAAAALCALTSGAAMAQNYPQDGKWMVRARAVHLDSANGGAAGDKGVSVNDKWIPELDISYFFTPNLAAELILTYPQKHDVRLNGAKIGTLKHLPPTLLAQYHFTQLGEGRIRADVVCEKDGERSTCSGEGNGRFDAVCNAIKSIMNTPYTDLKYGEHSLEHGSTSRAVAYVGLDLPENGMVWGVGIDNDIIAASIKALVSAVNRAIQQRQK